MGLDIRLPMGLMFSVLGLILAFFGLVSEKKIYDERSLGINVNLIWGLVMFLFGVAMLLLALRATRRERAKDGKPPVSEA